MFPCKNTNTFAPATYDRTESYQKVETTPLIVEGCIKGNSIYIHYFNSLVSMLFCDYLVCANVIDAYKHGCFCSNVSEAADPEADDGACDDYRRLFSEQPFFTHKIIMHDFIALFIICFSIKMTHRKGDEFKRNCKLEISTNI